MSWLCEHYNVPHETIKKMIKEGVISCHWESYEDVYKLWKEGKSAAEISDVTNRSQSSVWHIIRQFKKY